MKATLLLALFVIACASAAPAGDQKDEKKTPDAIPVIVALPVSATDVQKLRKDTPVKDDDTVTAMQENMRAGSVSNNVVNQISSIVGTAVVAIKGSVYYEIDGFRN